MKLWLNVADAAEHAGVCRDTIYTAVERGELRHVRYAPGRDARAAVLRRRPRARPAHAARRDDTLVLSNEAGVPLRLFHRTWQSIVLRAYGHTPTWAPRLNYHGLSDEFQATFRRINLRWHDLRHEYASRLVEHGVPLAQVRDLLGHASITTTERYDNQTLANLKIAAAKLERGHAFAHSARAKFQDSFKIEPSDAGPHAPREVPAIEANELADLNLGDWLGRRDSNPNNRVQSAVSYR